jgi:hypothetical protein
VTAHLHYADGTRTCTEIRKADDKLEVERWYVSEKANDFLRKHKIAPFEPEERLAVPTIHRFKLEGYDDGYPQYVEVR